MSRRGKEQVREGREEVGSGSGGRWREEKETGREVEERGIEAVGRE